VYSVRDFQDVDKIKSYAGDKNIRDVFIIGGSFIGTEASSCVKDAFKEANVTILNRSKFLFEGVFGSKVGEHIQKFVTSKGVNVKGSVRVDRIEDSNGRKVLHLNNGERVEADLVLYGIGDQPNTDYVPHDFLDSRDNSVIVNS
jgi:pyruvate/2-oxoglutarate dehydrogenase complex dihydrolipoamide dehydrogenase (E3) component